MVHKSFKVIIIISQITVKITILSTGLNRIKEGLTNTHKHIAEGQMKMININRPNTTLVLCQSRENHSLYLFLSENASVRYLPKTVGSVFIIIFFASSGFFKS